MRSLNEKLSALCETSMFSVVKMFLYHREHKVKHRGHGVIMDFIKTLTLGLITDTQVE